MPGTSTSIPTFADYVQDRRYNQERRAASVWNGRVARHQSIAAKGNGAQLEKDNKPEDTFEKATASMALGRNIALCTEFDPARYRDIAKQFKYEIIEIVMKSTFRIDTGAEEKATPSDMNKAKYELQKRLDLGWALA